MIFFIEKGEKKKNSINESNHFEIHHLNQLLVLERE